jgi:hypothetical protein
MSASDYKVFKLVHPGGNGHFNTAHPGQGRSDPQIIHEGVEVALFPFCFHQYAPVIAVPDKTSDPEFSCFCPDKIAVSYTLYPTLHRYYVMVFHGKTEPCQTGLGTSRNRATVSS